MGDIAVFQVESLISKNKTEGTPAYTRGRQLRFIGIPANMTGGNLSLHGSMDGQKWFPVRISNGTVLTFSTMVSNPKEVLSTQDSAAIIPIANPALFEGILFLAAVSDRPESEDQKVEFYLL